MAGIGCAVAGRRDPLPGRRMDHRSSLTGVKRLKESVKLSPGTQSSTRRPTRSFSVSLSLSLSVSLFIPPTASLFGLTPSPDVPQSPPPPPLLGQRPPVQFSADFCRVVAPLLRFCRRRFQRAGQQPCHVRRFHFEYASSSLHRLSIPR